MKTSIRPSPRIVRSISKSNRNRKVPKLQSQAPRIERAPLFLGLKHILVPIDLSRISFKALQYAVPLAKQFGAKITLLHVLEVPVSAPELGYLAAGGKDGRLDAKHRMEELACRTMPHGVEANVLIRDGVAFDTIATVAKKRSVDLVVLTTHGYTGLKRVLMGSTAERVVRHAHCPVLIVR